MIDDAATLAPLLRESDTEVYHLHHTDGDRLVLLLADHAAATRGKLASAGHETRPSDVPAPDGFEVLLEVQG